MALVFHPALNAPPRPRVSVCIANFNGAGLLADCIDSVLAQVGTEALEVIVHDDASSDGSVQLLRERWPQVALLASDANAGFCTANNRMAGHARGDYLLLLNNDAALFPDAIATLLDGARAASRPAILTLPQYDWESGALVDRGCLLDPFCNPIPNLDPARRDVAYAIGACLWIPRSLWRELGGFPEWMESIGEDLYLCGVARLRDVPVRALPGSGYRHRQGTSFGGNRAGSDGLRTSVKRRRLSERNKTRALFVLMPGWTMWPLLAAHLSALAIEGLVLSLLRRDTTLWRAVYAPAIATPLRDTSLLAPLRRKVQAARTTGIARWFSVVRWQSRKLVLLARFGIPKVQ